MAEKPETHRVAIRACDQYVFVQVDSPNLLSYRGKLVVDPGDKVELTNELETEILLVLPFMRRAEGDENIAPRLLTDKGDELSSCHVLNDLHVCAVRPGQGVVVVIPREASGGHYEYSILHRPGALSLMRGEQNVASLWAHALGGSSSEFIIRRPPF